MSGRFYRGPGPPALAPDGCGLGLNIARWIAESHGASIAFTSVPGGETRVKPEGRKRGTIRSAIALTNYVKGAALRLNPSAARSAKPFGHESEVGGFGNREGDLSLDHRGRHGWLVVLQGGLQRGLRRGGAGFERAVDFH